MRKSLWVIAIAFIFTTSCVVYVPYPKEKAPQEPEEYYERGYEDYYYDQMSVSFFYDYLSSYGMWVYNSPYGYVWIPDYPDYRWRPYTYGRWIWTNHGWTWASDFEWGWAPFHYGRWGWNRDLGWFWVPDTTWGPSWVTWRWSNLYIGWAPLPPEVDFVGVVRIDSLPFSLPNSFWIFIEGRYFLSPYLYRYVLPYERNITIVKYTIIRTNIYVDNYKIVNRGIDMDHIRKLTRREISKYQLQDTNQPGVSRIEAEEMKAFRPSLIKDRLAKPKKVISKEEAKERISKGTIKESLEKMSISEKESRLKDVHEHEIRILKKSQEKEVEKLRQELDEKKNISKESSEKKKLEKEYEEKIIKIKKNHEVEKSKIKQRHKTEEEKVKEKKEEKKIKNL